MLGVGVLFVTTDSSRLYGRISREDFINLRYRKDLVAIDDDSKNENEDLNIGNLF